MTRTPSSAVARLSCAPPPWLTPNTFLVMRRPSALKSSIRSWWAHLTQPVWHASARSKRFSRITEFGPIRPPMKSHPRQSWNQLCTTRTRAAQRGRRQVDHFGVRSPQCENVLLRIRTPLE